MSAAGTALLLALLAAVALVAIGQAGGLRGQPPDGLGVRDGRLAPPRDTPNSVSSQAGWHDGHAMAARAAIEPLPVRDSGEAELDRIHAIVGVMPGATVVRREPGYLYVQFTTRWLRFVDDAEFWHDPARGVVDVRSASRIGRRDFDANRNRVEAIRTRLLTPR